MNKLEMLQVALTEEGYFADLETERQVVAVSAKTGRRRPETNESATSLVAYIFFTEGQLILAKPLIPKLKTWPVNSIEEVVEYLLTHRPNIQVGEENTWT